MNRARPRRHARRGPRAEARRRGSNLTKPANNGTAGGPRARGNQARAAEACAGSRRRFSFTRVSRARRRSRRFSSPAAPVSIPGLARGLQRLTRVGVRRADPREHVTN